MSGETPTKPGGIEEDRVTFPYCRDLVDDWVLVDEEEIAQAVFYCLKHHKKVLEGAAGVALAAVGKVKTKYQGFQVAVVICGANISIKNLQKIIKNLQKKIIKNLQQIMKTYA